MFSSCSYLQGAAENRLRSSKRIEIEKETEHA